MANERHLAEERYVEHRRVRAMVPPGLGRRTSDVLRKTLASRLDRADGARFHCVVAHRPRASLFHAWEQTNELHGTLRWPPRRALAGEDGADAVQDGAL